MSISASEFARTLRRFARDEPLEQTGTGRWRIKGAVISIEPLEPLRTGALVLPRQRVRIDLSAMPGARRDAFLRRFGISFHRGGG